MFWELSTGPGVGTWNAGARCPQELAVWWEMQTVHVHRAELLLCQVKREQRGKEQRVFLGFSAEPFSVWFPDSSVSWKGPPVAFEVPSDAGEMWPSQKAPENLSPFLYLIISNVGEPIITFSLKCSTGFLYLH